MWRNCYRCIWRPCISLLCSFVLSSSIFGLISKAIQYLFFMTSFLPLRVMRNIFMWSRYLTPLFSLVWCWVLPLSSVSVISLPTQHFFCLFFSLESPILENVKRQCCVVEISDALPSLPSILQPIRYLYFMSYFLFLRMCGNRFA